MPFNYQTDSPLFTIPAETRQLIYSLLIPRGILDIEICTALRPSSNAFHGSRHISPIAALRQQFDVLNSIKQTNGIHLLLVCQWMRLEVLELLASVTVRFHCPECFNTFLPSVARGLGVGVEWMKSVEIVLDLTRTNQFHALSGAINRGGHLTSEFAKAMARGTMQRCQREAWKWYGPLHLSEKEKWTFDSVRTIESDIARDGQADDGSNIGAAAIGAVATGALVQHPPLAMNTHLAPPNTSNMARERTPMKWLITGKFDV